MTVTSDSVLQLEDKAIVKTTRKTTTKKRHPPHLYIKTSRRRRGGRGFQAPGRTTMKMTENLHWGCQGERKKKDSLLTADTNKTCQYVGASQKLPSSVRHAAQWRKDVRFPTRVFSHSTIIAQSSHLMRNGNQATSSLRLQADVCLLPPIRRRKEGMETGGICIPHDVSSPGTRLM